MHAEIACALAAVTACQPPRANGTDPEFRAHASGVEWELVELQGKTASTGAGGRRASLRFDADSARVSGFTGCNGMSGPYTLHGDSLQFGSLLRTEMACHSGMELEHAFLAALGATRRYELSSTQLKLVGATGTIARFSRPIPQPVRSPDT